MRRFKPVKRPERTVTVKTKSGTYVYLTNGVAYNKDKKRTEPKRTLIGKLNDEGLLIPNQNYIDIYGEEVSLDVEQTRSDYVSYGLKMVADKISANTQLKGLLENVFGDLTNKILDTACYMVASENNVMQYVDDYGFNHALFNKKVFDDSSVGKMFDKIQVRDVDLFIKSWVNMHASNNVYIAYDSTNMNSTAGNLELAEFGHAKDDKALPQVNVSLGYNMTNNMPLFYETYPGSIIDNYECSKMVERAASYGCKNVGFILDRGYFSMNNIRYFNEHGYKYLLMAKGNAKFIQDVINEYGPSVKNGYSYYIPDYDLYGLTTKVDLFKNKNPVYVHVYYNGINAEKEKLAINSKFHMQDKRLNELKECKIKRKEDIQAYSKYYDLRFDDNGYFLNYQRNDAKIKRLIDACGLFCIVSSEEMNAQEAISVYRNRDAVEKVFRMDKSYLGNDVFRVHSINKLESKMFVSFIALIIRNEICNASHRLIKGNQINKNEYTVPRIIRKLERIGVTKFSDDNYHQRYKLTSYLKNLLKQFGIEEKDFELYTKTVIDELNDC